MVSKEILIELEIIESGQYPTFVLFVCNNWLRIIVHFIPGLQKTEFTEFLGHEKSAIVYRVQTFHLPAGHFNKGNYTSCTDETEVSICQKVGDSIIHFEIFWGFFKVWAGKMFDGDSWIPDM